MSFAARSSSTECSTRPRASATPGLQRSTPLAASMELVDRRPGAQLVLTDPCGLQQDAPHERGVIAQIATPEAARLGGEAEQPFQPAALHPAGRALLESGVKVERRA